MLKADNKFEAEILERFRERLVKQFLDLIILNDMQKTTELSGYDIIAFVNKRFHYLISAGNVYGLLYSMERQGLVEGVWKERKRVYSATTEGKELLSAIRDMRDLDLRRLLF